MELRELFERLLKFKSITPEDGGAMEFIAEYLREFNIIRINRGSVKNLFIYKKFGEGEHLSFAGHIDVVPPGDGWDSNPFTPTYRDGYIYARGTQDMKSGVTAFLKALKEVKTFNGTLSCILTSDEEGEAKYGTIEVLRELKKSNLLPDFAIVAEPTSEKVFGDAIKIGRRGSINGLIEIIGMQGHAAYPEKSINPIHQIAPILPNIAGIDLDNGDENFSPSKIVITDIRGGMEVVNVTPKDLKIMFNIRNSTKTTKEDVEEYIKKQLKGLNYKLKIEQSAKPFVTNRDSKIVKMVEKSIKTILGVDTKLSTAGGTSDARFFGEYQIDTIEFGVINDTIHSTNERTTLKEVEGLYRVFKDIIEKF